MSNKKFVRLCSGMLATMAGFAVVLFVVAAMISGDSSAKLAASTVDETNQQVAERIQPVGKMRVADAKGREGLAKPIINAVIPSARAAEDKGKTTYEASCAACHAQGVAGAPKLGDKDAWKARIAQEIDVLYERAIKGYQGKAGFMPAKGGNTSLPDADVKAAVDYMIAGSK